MRHWRRYQAVLLRAAGTPVAVIARTLGCCEDSVTNWTNAWRRGGLAGIHEGTHAGAARRLDAAGEQRLGEVLTSDPQPAHVSLWLASPRQAPNRQIGETPLRWEAHKQES